MKKRYVLSIIVLAAIAVFVFFKFMIEFVYVGPYVETANLQYISKSVKTLNTALDAAMRGTYSHSSDMKFLYKNAYGSGFIKYNPIPNDLDYEAAIYLGKFEYDGNNAVAVAERISALMAVYEYQFYIYVDDKINPQFYTDMNSVNSLINVSHHRLQNEKLIAQSLPVLANDNDIFTSGFDNIILYGRNVKYNDKMANIPREIKVFLNFSADIENTTTKVAKRVNFVPQSYSDYRLSKRFFVPSVYTGETSASYLKDIKYLINDEDYFRNRINAVSKYIGFASDNVKFRNEPLKTYKTLIQTTGMIAPALTEKQQSDAYEYCYNNLDSNTSLSMNDYVTAFENLRKISSMPNLYNKINNQQEMNKFLFAMKNSLDSVKDEKGVDPQKISLLYKNLEETDKLIKSVKTNADIAALNSKLNEFRPASLAYANEIIIYNLKDKNKLYSYLTNYQEILTKAGYHKIFLYPQEDGTVGIGIDDFTSAFTPQDLIQLAKENGMVGTYVLVDNIPAERTSLVVRYKPSKAENSAYIALRIKMIEDRKNFKIKRRFMFVF